jgi:hypothetical protein
MSGRQDEERRHRRRCNGRETQVDGPRSFGHQHRIQGSQRFVGVDGNLVECFSEVRPVFGEARDRLRRRCCGTRDRPLDVVEGIGRAIHHLHFGEQQGVPADIALTRKPSTFWIHLEAIPVDFQRLHLRFQR